MIVITTPLGAIGLLALVHLGMLFANFSRRLGSVTKMARRYVWFVWANYLIALAAVSQIIRGIAALAPEKAWPILLAPWFPLVTFQIPLAIGITLDLWMVWYYWGWIWREKVA